MSVAVEATAVLREDPVQVRDDGGFVPAPQQFGFDLFRAWRFFLIPEEAVPPRELRWTALGFKRAPDYADFRAAVVDPVANALVCSAGTARAFQSDATRRERLALLQTALLQGPAKLDAIQKNMLLTDSLALSRLHYLVWTSTEAHESWTTVVDPAPMS